MERNMFWPTYRPVLSNGTETASKIQERKITTSLPREVNVPSVIEQNPELRKYWMRRYSLFSKYDKGIKLDKETWYSVIPEVIMKEIAERCACKVIVDAYCGAGGNSIQLAMYCEKVIAMDPDHKKIELARHNAKIYGVSHKIRFIVADFFKSAYYLRADVVFLTPPWGGPIYTSVKKYNLETMLQTPLSKLIKVARKVTNNVAFYLPRHSDTSAFSEASEPDTIELKYMYLGHRMGIAIYYNGLVKRRIDNKVYIKSEKD